MGDYSLELLREKVFSLPKDADIYRKSITPPLTVGFDIESAVEFYNKLNSLCEILKHHIDNNSPPPEDDKVEYILNGVEEILDLNE
jgi:hypothetical protein